MTQTVEAVYQNCVFKPLGRVGLSENQRVRLSVQPIEPADVAAWLATIQQHQQELLAKYGPFPDSAAEIAADRMRDE